MVKLNAADFPLATMIGDEGAGVLGAGGNGLAPLEYSCMPAADHLPPGVTVVA